MMKFIEQYKTTGYDDGGFSILRERTDNPRTLLFLDIAEQVYKKQSLENIQYSSDTPYTSQLIVQAIENALKKAETTK